MQTQRRANTSVRDRFLPTLRKAMEDWALSQRAQAPGDAQHTSACCGSHSHAVLPFITGERRGDEKPGGDVPGLEGTQHQE